MTAGPTPTPRRCWRPRRRGCPCHHRRGGTQRRLNRSHGGVPNHVRGLDGASHVHAPSPTPRTLCGAPAARSPMSGGPHPKRGADTGEAAPRDGDPEVFQWGHHVTETPSELAHGHGRGAHSTRLPRIRHDSGRHEPEPRADARRARPRGSPPRPPSRQREATFHTTCLFHRQLTHDRHLTDHATRQGDPVVSALPDAPGILARPLGPRQPRPGHHVEVPHHRQLRPPAATGTRPQIGPHGDMAHPRREAWECIDKALFHKPPTRLPISAIPTRFGRIFQRNGRWEPTNRCRCLSSRNAESANEDPRICVYDPCGGVGMGCRGEWELGETQHCSLAESTFTASSTLTVCAGRTYGHTGIRAGSSAP